MSFTLPPVKANAGISDQFGIEEGAFGVKDAMLNGLASSKHMNAYNSIEASELVYRNNLDRMNFAILRNTQGLHAPLRLTMEMNSAKKIGRLPFLPSSNVMLEALTGRDLEIGPEDIFNTSDFIEMSRQPHALVERSLGLM